MTNQNSELRLRYLTMSEIPPNQGVNYFDLAVFLFKKKTLAC